MQYDGLILAGGRGIRLRPITDTTPKPLIKVKGRPLLEWILKRYVDAGFERVHIGVRYLGHKIRERFGNKYETLAIEYLDERDALGTAGCIALLKSPAPLVVSNGDLYTSLDFRDLIKTHEIEQADATVVSVPRQIPFGVVCWPNAQDEIITERPTVAVNAGMYVLSKHVVSAVLMSSAHKQDMPDVVNRVAMFGGKVSAHHLPAEQWHDVGTPEDLERVNAA